MAFMAWRASGGARGEGIKRCPQCRYFIGAYTPSYIHKELTFSAQRRMKGACT
jgi:hypothetical protein